MSGGGGGGSAPEGSGWSGHGSSPRRAGTSSASVLTARTLCRPTSSASRADASATTTASASSTSTIGTVPDTDRTAPSRPSSPMKPMPRTTAASSCSEATSTPIAIGEVEAAAALAGARRRQVHRDPLERPVQPARQQRRPDTVARLATRGVGQADDGEAGQTVRDVDLDVDRAAVDAEDRGGRDDGEHRIAPPLDPPAPCLAGRRGRLADRPRSWAHGTRGV